MNLIQIPEEALGPESFISLHRLKKKEETVRSNDVFINFIDCIGISMLS